MPPRNLQTPCERGEKSLQQPREPSLTHCSRSLDFFIIPLWTIKNMLDTASMQALAAIGLLTASGVSAAQVDMSIFGQHYPQSVSPRIDTACVVPLFADPMLFTAL